MLSRTIVKNEISQFRTSINVCDLLQRKSDFFFIECGKPTTVLQQSWEIRAKSHSSNLFGRDSACILIISKGVKFSSRSQHIFSAFLYFALPLRIDIESRYHLRTFYFTILYAPIEPLYFQYRIRNFIHFFFNYINDFHNSSLRLF